MKISLIHISNSREFGLEKPYLKQLNPPNIAPVATPTQNPIKNPNFTLAKHDGWETPRYVFGAIGIATSI